MNAAAFCIDPDHLKILRHSVGLDELGYGRQYRNHYATTGESIDGQMCQALCVLGFMKDHGPQAIWEGMRAYSVTEEGKRVVQLHEPIPPKISRSRRRYLDFLAADSGLTFGEYLKRKTG